MKNYSSLALGAILLCACSGGQQQAATTTESSTSTQIVGKGEIEGTGLTFGIPQLAEGERKAVLADGVKLDSALPFEQLQQRLLDLPDHCIAENSERSFTPEYYAILSHAFAVPSDGLGEIGSDECLCYFISGQDFMTDLFIVRSVDIKGDSAIVQWNNGCTEWLNQTNNKINEQCSTMRLVRQGSTWLVDDFDNTKQLVSDYIAQQRKFFRSADWKRAKEEALQYLKQENIDAHQADVDSYFERYKD